jgi:hypothetical protein
MWYVVRYKRGEDTSPIICHGEVYSEDGWGYRREDRAIRDAATMNNNYPEFEYLVEKWNRSDTAVQRGYRLAR